MPVDSPTATTSDHTFEWTRTWRMAMDSLWRDWRSGDLKLLALAVVLAVAALTSVAFIADRLAAGLQRDALALLGGDAVLSSDRATPQSVADLAKASGLVASTSMSFPTMARTQAGEARLIALKAVDDAYPLRGQLRLKATRDANAVVQTGAPAPGTVWVDAQLLETLNVNVGDSLLLGDARFRIDRLIAQEPDRGSGFMNFAPRVMLNRLDLPATQLVQPASRITWRFAVAATDANARGVKNFNDAVAQQMASGSLRGARLENLESGRPEMRQTLDRAGRFLNLVALLSALLSAVAIAIAARGFAQSHLDGCAMLRVLGCSQRRIAWAYTLEFLTVGLVASAVGIVGGYALHALLLQVLSGLFDAQLPAAGFWPPVLGVGVGLCLLLAFGLPPVLQLASVPALRVIRREMGQISSASAGVLGVGVAGFAALLMATSADWKLGGISLGGFAVASALFAGLSALAVWALKRGVREESAPQWLSLATRQMASQPIIAVLQSTALALGLLALVLLVLVRTDLVRAWRQASPPDAPNRFVINLQPEQRQGFEDYLVSAQVKKADVFPMIRGRLLSVNGKAVSPDQYTDDRAKRLVDREFNLSHAAAAPAHNVVTEGLWSAGAKDEISVEEGIAQTLNVKLGDRLVFDVAGIEASARITSIRKVDWGSMRANFFVMFTVDAMPELPATFMSAFKAPAAQGFDNQLLRLFPNVTNVDMTQTIDQVQRVLNQVIRAVEFLFGFTLAAGLLVLVTTLTATRETRAREFAVLRALGASSTLLARVQRAELLGLGALAGFLASSTALLLGWLLAKYAFEFEWTAPLWVAAAGTAFGALLAWGTGHWGLRDVLKRPVMASLRAAAE